MKNKAKRIAVIGEFYINLKPHTALNDSIEHVKKKYGLGIGIDWIDTLRAEKEGKDLFVNYSGFWSAPGSPFKSLEGAISAIEYARINDIPHLGTCAGFQHTVIEFARNVLLFKEAQHEEYDKNSSALFINKMVCSLAGKRMNIKLLKGSKAYECYRSDDTIEDYYCNFGINPKFSEKMKHDKLLISGIDNDGEIRIIEYPANRFFVSTLFVPQINSTDKSPNPIIERFVLECLK